MRTRITRSIAPTTGISRPHISGTRSRPSSRAATAGNSASRSSVQVKKQLTIRSGSRRLRASSSRNSSPVAARIEAASLRSAWAAPRTAQIRSGASFIEPGILPEPLDIGRSEPPGLADLQLAEPDRPEADALEDEHLVADRRRHPPHLAIAT